MIVFVDTISPLAGIVLLDGGAVIGEKRFRIHGQEFGMFLDTFLAFLAEHGRTIRDVSGILAIRGPGGFTGTRILSLVLNTMQFVSKIPLESIDYFEFLEKSDLEYPMIIKANRSEYLLKESKSAPPHLIGVRDVPEGTYAGIGDSDDFQEKKISIIGANGYNSFVRNHTFGGTMRRIDPYYVKKPNIT